MTIGSSGNLTGRRASVTINHGTIAVGSTNFNTATITGLAVGDRVIACPVAAPVAGILVGQARVSTTNVIEVAVANVTTATIAAGTAVVYDVQIFKATGST